MDENNIQLTDNDIQAIQNVRGNCSSRGIPCRHLVQFRCPRYRRAIIQLLDKYMEKHVGIKELVEKHVKEYVDAHMSELIEKYLLDSLTVTATAHGLPYNEPPTVEVEVTP